MSFPTSRKYPRSMNEAFGPYAHLTPIEDNDPPPIDDVVVTVVSIVTAVALVVFLAFEVI